MVLNSQKNFFYFLIWGLHCGYMDVQKTCSPILYSLLSFVFLANIIIFLIYYPVVLFRCLARCLIVCPLAQVLCVKQTKLFNIYYPCWKFFQVWFILCVFVVIVLGVCLFGYLSVCLSACVFTKGFFVLLPFLLKLWKFDISYKIIHYYYTLVVIFFVRGLILFFFIVFCVNCLTSLSWSWLIIDFISLMGLDGIQFYVSRLKMSRFI